MIRLTKVDIQDYFNRVLKEGLNYKCLPLNIALVDVDIFNFYKITIKVSKDDIECRKVITCPVYYSNIKECSYIVTYEILKLINKLMVDEEEKHIKQSTIGDRLIIYKRNYKGKVEIVEGELTKRTDRDIFYIRTSKQDIPIDLNDIIYFDKL